LAAIRVRAGPNVSLVLESPQQYKKKLAMTQQQFKAMEEAKKSRKPRKINVSTKWNKMSRILRVHTIRLSLSTVKMSQLLAFRRMARTSTLDQHFLNSEHRKTRHHHQFLYNKLLYKNNEGFAGTHAIV
jgi:hypothetical protein